jgi:hypothetical protein
MTAIVLTTAFGSACNSFGPQWSADLPNCTCDKTVDYRKTIIMTPQKRIDTRISPDRGPSRTTTVAWPPAWLGGDERATAVSPVSCDQPNEPLLSENRDQSSTQCRHYKTTVAKTGAIACRCGSTETVGVSIHNGQSIRDDCAGCGRFHCFSLWYGKISIVG